MSTSPAISAESGNPNRAPANVTRWERFSFSVVHGGAGLLFKLFGLRGLYALSRWFATLEWLINYKRRRRFRAVLREVFDPELAGSQRRRMTREYFMTTRCDKLFYLIFDWIPKDRAQTLVKLKNRELLDAAVRREIGVYVGLAHHGAHHAMGLLMPLLGYKVAGVRDRNEGGLRRFIQQRFDQKYPEFQRGRVLFSDSFPREIFRTLQEGYILGSAMDVARIRDANQKLEEVTVFGQKRPFLTGPLWIAVRCRVPILQAFVIPEPNFRYRVEMLALQPDPAAITDDGATVSQCIAAYATNVERYTRDYPHLITRV